MQEKVLSDTGIAFNKEKIANSFIGKINFNHASGPESDCVVSIYLIQEPVFIDSPNWSTTRILPPEGYHFITETDSMKPYLFTSNALPYESMPPLDQYWLPRIMQGHSTYASLLINPTGNILKYEENSYPGYHNDE